MFDFDAGKLIIIGIAALIFIPPKDLPRVLRELGRALSKMRRMAFEFQSQFMEAVREADVADLKADVAKLAESAKFDLPANPLSNIKAELKAAIEKPATDSAAAAGLETSAPALARDASAPPREADDDDAPDPAIRDVEAEMQALASALKAEIAAAPKAAALDGSESRPAPLQGNG